MLEFCALFIFFYYKDCHLINYCHLLYTYSIIFKEICNLVRYVILTHVKWKLDSNSAAKQETTIF
jgi:hypothetical protein